MGCLMVWAAFKQGLVVRGMSPAVPGVGLNCSVLCPAVFGTDLFQSNCSPSPFQHFNYSIKEIET